MTIEELRIRITAETLEARNAVENLRRNIGNLNNTSTNGLSSNLTSSYEGAEQLHEQLEAIRGMSFVGLAANLGNIVNDFRRGREAAREYRETVAEAQAMLDRNSHVYNGPNSYLEWEDATTAADHFNAHMAEANDTITEARSTMGGFLANIPKGAIVALASIAALTAGIAAMVMQIKNAIRVAQQMKQTFYEAQKIGLSTAEYQKWGYVLQSVGVEADSLSDFIKTLSDEQATLREGSEGISKALEQLGMDIDDVVNMSQEQLFTETVTRLQEVENQVDKTALAYQIFGEDAAQLANVINMSNGSIQALMRNYQLLGGEASDTLVSKSLELQQAISNMKVAWAGLGNTLAEWIMPTITAVVRWITVAIAKINMFVRAILGYDIVSKGTTSATKKAAGGMSSYGNAVNNTSKAIEKLKRSLMGFDELNVLPGEDSSGSGVASGDFGSIGGALGDFGTQGILSEADLESLDRFKEKIEEMKGFLQGFIPIALTTIGIIGCLVCLFTGNWVGAIAFGAMAGLGISIGIENGAWAKMAEGIKNIWENIKKWWNDNVAPVFTKEWWAEKWDIIKKTLGEKLGEIKKKFEEKIEEIKAWYETNVAPKLTKEYWKTQFDNIKQGLREKIDEIKSSIEEKWNNVKKWWNTNVAPKFTKTYWKEKFDTIKKGAQEKLEEAKTTIINKWNNIKNWFSTNVKPKFTIAYWKEKWNTIKDGAKEAFNGVISVIETAINNIIDKINGVSWTIPDWVPQVGGRQWGFNFNHVSIPRLAQGGITNGSTIANIGEGGYKEAVLPLERNTGWMDMLADRIAARQTQAPTVLQIDGKTFAQTSIDAINNLTRQTGSLKLILS